MENSNVKDFYTQYGIGRAKYLVNYHDGIMTNKDGSKFYGIKIFKNKKLLKVFIDNLIGNGYIERI